MSRQRDSLIFFSSMTCFHFPSQSWIKTFSCLMKISKNELKSWRLKFSKIHNLWTIILKQFQRFISDRILSEAKNTWIREWKILRKISENKKKSLNIYTILEKKVPGLKSWLKWNFFFNFPINTLIFLKFVFIFHRSLFCVWWIMGNLHAMQNQQKLCYFWWFERDNVEKS